MNQEQIKAAREALDNMDDYARMNTGVDAIGPRGVLERFISEAERTTAPASLTDDDLTQEFSLDAITKGIRYADNGRHEGWQAELKEYIRIECNRALLAAAPAPIQQEPVAPARQALHTMQYEDGRIGWYFDCDGHYIDVEKDGAGKYSVYFRDRATGKEGWLDQADSATPPALAGSQVQDVD